MPVVQSDVHDYLEIVTDDVMAIRSLQIRVKVVEEVTYFIIHDP